MDFNIENALLIIGVLVFASVIASKTSLRVGVPTLIFFLAIGMLAGSEGLGKIEFSNAGQAQSIGVVGLCIVLFSGGFDTSWKEVRPVVWKGALLATLGVLLTAVSLGLFVSWLIPGFSLAEGLLLGAIVSSTDVAAVLSVLRSKSLGLKGGIRPLLELESGSNDPMAYMITLAFLGMVVNPQGHSLGSQVLFLMLQLGVGLSLGLAFGYVCRFLINKIKIEYESLYPIMMIGLVFLTYSLTTYARGNGLLAVYVMAVFLGNSKLAHKKTISTMFDGFAWLMQITIFIVLGLLVAPSEILPVMGVGLLISGFLMLVARPLSVLISLLPFKMPINKKFFVSWVGLKGAVPIVFATYPLVAGLDKAGLIFNIVFFISITSVLIQGTTLSPMAKLLRVTEPFFKKKKISIDIEMDDAEDVKSKFARVVVPEGSKAVGVPLFELDFPQKASISLIIRSGVYITPYGATVLEAHDKLLVVAEDVLSMQQALEGLEAHTTDVEWGEV